MWNFGLKHAGLLWRSVEQARLQHLWDCESSLLGCTVEGMYRPAIASSLYDTPASMPIRPGAM